MVSNKIDKIKEKIIKNQEYIERQISILEDIESLKLQNREKMTLSYQLGHAIFESMKSIDGLVDLPKQLIGIHKEAKRRKDRKSGNKSKIINTDIISSDHNRHKGKKKFPNNLHIKTLRVACICDEFTYSSFKEEYQMLQLSHTSWKAEIKQFDPHFVFIESAWKGKDNEWQTVISNFKDELKKLIQFTRQKSIPTCFWNKEDPVHFSSFIEIAKHVDHVFTTDIDCIPKYKHHLKHDRVYLLPFAAQSKHHNPIEKYQRSDKACFAGSYYLRYPERQRDFSDIIQTTKEICGTNIYDRNHGQDHPHYNFPDEYKPLIIGKLPFEEIDKAYKGYEYGINMNTIKQSQTMFARRVFELIASNTTVISNFSRGVRNFFGDYVICSDNPEEIHRRLSYLKNNPLEKNKIKLNAMRHVLKNHTYKQRAEFIVDKIFDNTPSKTIKTIGVISSIQSQDDLDYLLPVFKNQDYESKLLFIIDENKHICTDYVDTNVIICENKEDITKKIQEFNIDYCALFNLKDFYAPNYITDLVLATEYSNVDVITKDNFYEIKNNALICHEGEQYKFVKDFFPRKSLIKLSFFLNQDLSLLLNDQNISTDSIFSIDIFNYCLNGRNADLLQKEEFTTKDNNKTIDLEKIDTSIIQADNNKNTYNNNIYYIKSKELYDTIIKPSSSKVTINFTNNNLRIQSSLEDQKHVYIYFSKKYDRNDINMLLNSAFIYRGIHTLNEVRTVAVFFDHNGQKISHAMNNNIDVKHQLAIPRECKTIQFGLRIVGKGNLSISSIGIGSPVTLPTTFLGKSDILCVAKQYPSYDDIYKYGFLHTRLKAYHAKGQAVDMLRLNPDLSKPFSEYENIDSATGNLQMLDQILASGQYKHILVHLIDHHIWSVLEKYIDKIQVTIWVHGAEAQSWKRRSYEFFKLSEDEINRKKKLSDQRMAFWKNLTEKEHKNLKLIFVSENFKKECEEDFNYSIKNHNYGVIHNPVDTNIFNYVSKPPEQRLKLLSIRPYASEKYANDLTVKTIMLLKNKPYFNQLEFSLFGDGEFFEILTKPLQGFKNINLHKRFLQHVEIADQHKKHGIFLTPTRMDAQGVSRDEAMASGLVPITNNIAAVPEFVNDSVGFMADPEDAQQMADFIDKLYYDPNLFMKMSKAASKHVYKNLNVDHIIGQEIKEIKRHMNG